MRINLQLLTTRQFSLCMTRTAIGPPLHNRQPHRFFQGNHQQMTADRQALLGGQYVFDAWWLFHLGEV
ncbi:hypothetical protein B9Z39_10365 [Limnohabitans sp. JirII-29]|nr:hypothetical protein B9Z39_10365 [Limnohabitans sp. JirII-29]